MPKFIATYRRDRVRGTKKRTENGLLTLFVDTYAEASEEAYRVAYEGTEDDRINWDWSPQLGWEHVPGSFRLDEEEPIRKVVRPRGPEDPDPAKASEYFMCWHDGGKQALLYEKEGRLTPHFDENDHKYYDIEEVRSLANATIDFRWGP